MTASKTPRNQNKEKHFTATETVHDIVIGMSDGLTVPFALAAGLTGVVTSSHIIIAAGFAEIAAGSITMCLADTLLSKGMWNIMQASEFVKSKKYL